MAKKDRLGVASNANRRRSVGKAIDERRRNTSAPTDGEGGEDEYEDMDLAPIEVRKKPVDQVELTPEQLGETFTKMIGGGDPNVCDKMANFHFEAGEYTVFATTDHLKVHYAMDGVLIHRETDEAKMQAERAAEEVDSTIKNQFNFSERGTQTFTNPMRSKEVCTEPPPTGEFNGQVTQWGIFDTYLEEFEKKIIAAAVVENKKNKKKGGEEDEDEGLNIFKKSDDIFASKKLGRAMKMMERLLHTNAEAEDFTYFKYYEDKNEVKREDGRGSFMALWRFEFEKAARKSVTTMCWNPEFIDLFAVGFGSFDFGKQTNGMICCYTLKNTSHPEFVFECESGVMCLDFNPEHSSLLCVGMYDGTVAVYDLREKNTEPIFASNSPETKHTDPVWQVYWGKEDVNKGINFYSVSSDGHVANWELSKTELAREEVVELKLQPSEIPTTEEEAADAQPILGLGGGSCFHFNPSNNDIFVVGTEEGAIQSYSKAYNAEFLRGFTGHHMAIYSVVWNKFHPDVFLSCSADWTVKLWEANTSKPIMTFDLNTSVGDVVWSPFSSTVFATITTDGKVRVYDLNVNKHEPIGEYRGNKKAKLTKICFNPVEPIVCVGDDRGVVLILKLSNNLRKMSASSLEEINVEDEIEKLNRVMIMPEDKDEDDVAALLEAANKGNTNIGKKADVEAA